MFFEVLLVFFFLLNLNIFVTKVLFSVADRRKIGWAHIQTESNPLAEMLEC